MSSFDFDSRGWGPSARVTLKFIPTVSHYPTSNSDPLIYTAPSWTIYWGDGDTDTSTTSSSPSSSVSVTHDYGASYGPRTLTVSTSTDDILEFKITGAGLTSIDVGLVPALNGCVTYDFSNNFLTALPDLHSADSIITFIASYNNLSGTLPQFSTIARLNTINLSHNGYDTLDDLNQYAALLTCDVSYNPITSYLGTDLPLYMTALRIQHCKLDSATINSFGAQLETNLTYSNQFLHTQTASVVAGVAVSWVDFVYDPPPGVMHVALPFDATNWPDPAVIGKYNIYSFVFAGSLNYTYQPDPAQRLTAVSKAGSTLTCEITWRDGQFCVIPMTNAHGALESHTPGSGSFANWNPPIGSEAWEDFTFTRAGSGLREHQAEGGENGVPSAGAQTSWDNVKAATPWYGTGITPVYNEVAQNNSHPRTVGQLQGGGGGVDYSRVGWMGKRYKASVGDGDTPDMQTVHFAHLMSGIATARKALVVVWYSGLGTMAGDHVDSITLNGTALTAIGPTIHETNPVASPFNLESFISGTLPQENMLELLFHLDAAADQIAFTVCFVRDAGPLSYTDRPVADTDPVIGRTNWDILTHTADMIVVAAGSRFAGNTSTPIHSDGQFRASVDSSGNDVIDPWIAGDQNPSLAGNTLLYKTGVRPEGTNGTTSNWYWTHASTSDWTTVGGAARAFIFGHKTAGRVRAFLMD